MKVLLNLLGASVNQEAYIQVSASISYKQPDGLGEALLVLRLEGDLS